MAGIEHDTCSKPAMSIHEHHRRPVEHHGVKRGTLSMSQYAASAASSWSSTSAKLLRCVKDVPDASARRLQLNPWSICKHAARDSSTMQSACAT